MAYSPLFRQLQGKRWAGEAHAVRVTAGGPAQANLFVIEPTTKAARVAGRRWLRRALHRRS